MVELRVWLGGRLGTRLSPRAKSRCAREDSHVASTPDAYSPPLSTTVTITDWTSVCIVRYHRGATELLGILFGWQRNLWACFEAQGPFVRCTRSRLYSLCGNWMGCIVKATRLIEM